MSQQSKSKRLAKGLLPEHLLQVWHLFRVNPTHHRVVYPYTLVSPLQLLFLEELCRRTLEAETPGDFVECGVYKGGSAAILGFAMMRSPGARHLRLFDAFSGMPAAGERDDRQSHELAGQYVGSERQTRRVLRRVGVPDDRYELVSGWFEDTLPHAPKRPIALLHVDCDFYEPVKLSLENFYPAVSPGGFVVLNDYGTFAGCRTATDEFLSLNPGIEPRFIDSAAVYIQKPGAGSDA